MMRARRGPSRGGLSRGGNRSIRKVSGGGGGSKSSGCAVVVLAGLATSVILAAILGHVVGAA